MFLQKTIRKDVEVHGIGLHSGKPATLRFSPAPANTGVYFIRNDLPGRPHLKVHNDFVSATSYATTLSCPEFSVSTVEHCLSTLSALRVDNLFIELDGPEIPICDGSAKDFLLAFQKCGVMELDEPRKYFYITEPITLVEGDKTAQVVPYHGLKLSVGIDFPHPSIGKQNLEIDINDFSFAHEIAPARTFGFLKEVQTLRNQGLALGGSLQNALVLDESQVLNAEGLRFKDEFVRHKVLDALGDLVTLGHPLMGHLTLYKAGHDLMQKFVRKILQSESTKLVELGADLSEAQKLKSI